MSTLLEQLAALAELQKQATPGPWLDEPDLRPAIKVERVGSEYPGGGWGYDYVNSKEQTVQVGIIANIPKYDKAIYDAAFIAAAGSLDFAALHAALSPAPVAAGGAGGAGHEEALEYAARRVVSTENHYLNQQEMILRDLQEAYEKRDWQYIRELIGQLETDHIMAVAPSAAARPATPAAAVAAEAGGDGGIGAMQDLAAYFQEAGHWDAYKHIRSAAHSLGWCIDDGGADRIAPTTTGCPLCGYADYIEATAPSQKGGQDA